MYADNLALISKSLCGLQQSVDALHKLAKWGINIDKTEVLRESHELAVIFTNHHQLHNVDTELLKQVQHSTTGKTNIYYSVFSKTVKLGIFKVLTLPTLMVARPGWSLLRISNGYLPFI